MGLRRLRGKNVAMAPVVADHVAVTDYSAVGWYETTQVGDLGLVTGGT